MIRILAIMILCLVPSFAQENEKSTGEDKENGTSDLLTLDETTTVSKKKEEIWYAPGVVSQVGAAQIRMFGDSSLWEIAERLPGVQNTFGTAINRTSVRGGEPNNAISHVLVLVDGRPVRASGGNLSAYSPFYTFPMESIERVEVSRGPASAIYGTNAMEGVINLITRKEEGSGLRFRMQGGSFDTRKAEMAGHYQRGDFKMQAGLKYTDIEGWEYRSNTRDGGSFSKDVFEDSKGLNLKAEWRGLSLNLTYGDTKQFSVLDLQDNDPLNFHSQVTVLDLGYTRLVGSWNMDFHLTQNHEIFDWNFNETPVFPLYTNDWLGEVTAYGLLGPVNIIAGATLSLLKTGTNGGVVSTPYEGTTLVSGAYVQAQYRPDPRVEFTLGGQYNRPEGFEDAFVPRLGVVWHFDPDAQNKTGLKMLYGEAFRSPSLLETTIDTPGIQKGNPNLKPEWIETLDLQLFHYSNQYEISLAAYQSRQSDLISLVPTADYLIGEYFNVAHLESKGLELEGRYASASNLFFQLAMTFQESKDDSGLAQVSKLPHFNWKGGFGFRSELVELGVYNTHNGAYLDDPNTLHLNPDSTAVDLVSANINLALERLFSLGRLEKFGFQIKGTNLLDEQIWVTDYLSRRYNTTPGGPGRAVYAGLNFVF